jgi:protoporphyrinogen oxidase
MTSPSVGIVGGGILGMTAALRLAEAGVKVALYERAADLGGLVGTVDAGGHRVDRFDHVILPTDHRVIGLATELGLGDRFRFRPTKVGFYDAGRLFSMTTPGEAMTFPLLRPQERVRLAAFVARCQLTTSYERLDDEPLEEWLGRHCGQGALDKLWRPLLDSKFDGRYGGLPATYIWARTRRMGTTRDRSGREVLGWLQGGYQTLIDAVEARIRELGGEVHAGTPVERVVSAGGRAIGLVVGGRLRRFDELLCTLAPPEARRLLPDDLLAAAPPDHCRYVGVVSLLMRTSRSVSPYYHLNITDRRVPLTTVVETTHVVDPEQVGGHLVYVSRYVAPDHPLHGSPAADVHAEMLGHARTIFPDLRDDEIRHSLVQRARITEPVHLLGGAKRLPDMFAIPGMAMASTAHVYPEIVSGQAVIGVVDQVVPGILERLPAQARAAA